MCCPEVLQTHMQTINMEVKQKRPGYIWGSQICFKKKKKAEAIIPSALTQLNG